MTNRTPEQNARNNEYHRKRWAEDSEYRERRQAPEYRARQAEFRRNRKYGLTPEQHVAMFEAQGGLCAICRGEGGKKGLAVDHCHDTGVVRGLLCGECNIGIGKLGDTPEGLMRALKYLREARKRQQLSLFEK